MALLSPVILLGVVAWSVLYLITSRFFVWKRLRHIPGPLEVGWSKFWLVRHQYAGRLCLDLEAVNKKYGAWYPSINLRAYSTYLAQAP